MNGANCKCSTYIRYTMVGRICTLKLGQIKFELFGGRIDSSHLDDSLHTLGGNTKADVSVEVFGKESLPLEVDALDLLDASVRKGHNTSLAIGRLSEQVADAGSHFHRSCPTACL